MDDFALMLANIEELKKEGQWEQVQRIVGKRLTGLVGVSPKAIIKLTELGLVAELVKSGPTVWVPYKRTMLIALLKEAGDVATVLHPPGGGYGWYKRSLHLLLDALKHDELHAISNLVPTIEVLLTALVDSRLPIGTRLRLMQEYERRGWYARARNEFQTALTMAPENCKLLEFGIIFLERIRHDNDVTLANGNIQRVEIEAMLSELRNRSVKASVNPVGHQ
jgi:hypothetical protein